MKKILVVGYGSIGLRHVNNLKQFNCKVSILENQRKEFPNDCKIYREINDIDEIFDGIIISTPTSDHIKCLNNLLSFSNYFLIEKPVSNNETEKKKVKKKRGKKIFVSCNMRFHDAINIIKKNLKLVGDVYYAHAFYGYYLPYMRKNVDYEKVYCSKFNKGGGVIFDTIHEIDYLWWLFGSIKKISSHSFKLSKLKINVEDFSNTVLQHKSGVISNILVDYLSQYKKRGCEIVGQKGSILWNSYGKEKEKYIVKFFKSSGEKVLLKSENFNNNQPYIDLLENFFNAIDNKKNKLLSFDDAFLQVKLINKIRRKFSK